VSWEHEVVAFNTATESVNRMHDDVVASTYGFRGGLVPGVDVWAYLTRPCIDRWGADFLGSGTMTVRFLLPVYDGEVVTARLDDDGTLRAIGPDGTERARGSASIAEPHPAPREIPSAPLPDRAPAATAELLAPGTVLGTLSFTYRSEHGPQYARDVRDDAELYRDGSVCHPGQLARQANWALSRNVTLGPWIHVGTTAHHRTPVHDGQPVEVRAAVSDEREHKGHRFVDLDVEVTADGEPAWSAAHTAIWRPRQPST
jgi:hypothetical protein